MTERTADGRHVVVDGRRWRATDPNIPEKLRAELVAELMSARRAVRDQGDAARPRVRDAKVALGERGEPWWEDSTPAGRDGRSRSAICALLRNRDAASTICPSDVAKVVGGAHWRMVMDDVRAAAAALAADGRVRITQRGAEVDLGTVRGPVRIGRGAGF